MPQSIEPLIHEFPGHAAASSGSFVEQVVVADRVPVAIPQQFIDPQSELTIAIENPIEIPVETIEQENRRKLIQRNLDRSTRMREIGLANRAKKAVSHPTALSSPLACSSLPARALPIYNCGDPTPPPRLNRGVINNSNPTKSRGPITHEKAVRRDFDLFEYACSDTSSVGIEGPLLGVKVCRLTLKPVI